MQGGHCTGRAYQRDEDGKVLGHRLDQHVNGTKTDFVKARQVVNAMDHAQEFFIGTGLVEQAVDGGVPLTGALN